MSRKRVKSAALEELELENDRIFSRVALSGTLHAGLLFSELPLDRARLVASWHCSEAESTDVGGKRGLAQESVAEVLEAVRRLLDVPEPLESDVARFADVPHQFVASNPPNPVSILAAGAALAAWKEASLTALFGGRDRIHLGWPRRGASPPSERPWLQVLGGFQMGRTTDAVQGMIQLETVAESWRESVALAKSVAKHLPFEIKSSDAALRVSDISATGVQMGLIKATFDDWELCRCILRVLVRAEI
ncbi:MAG: hypothetical protein FJ267_07795 [Planctomycetes bacterium]|nr:hypothetical protein [Planctomycetota bacterium]